MNRDDGEPAAGLTRRQMLQALGVLAMAGCTRPRRLPDDDIEHRIAAFQQENEAWASIWRNSYREVERAMRTFRAMSLDDRAAASRWLLSWHDGLARAGNGIPFRPEAEQFAEVYWRSRV